LVRHPASLPQAFMDLVRAPPAQPCLTPSRETMGRVVPRMLAVVLILLGVTVGFGWLARLPLLVQIIPGMTAMVLVTAAGFVLLGIAILMPPCSPAARLWPLLPASAVVILVSLNLVQIATGLDLGINLTTLHDWIDGGNPRPGEQAFSTSVSFLLAAQSLLALTAIPRPSVRLIAAGRHSAALLFAISVAALLGYALRLQVLLDWYLFAKMALSTAVAIGLLSVALWWRWDALEDRQGGEERDLRRLVSVSMVMVALFAATSAVAVFRHEGERAMERSQSQARDSMAEGLQAVFSLEGERASGLATNPALQSGLARLREHPDDPAVFEEVRLLLTHYLAHRFSYLAVRDGQGQLLIEIGRQAPSGGLILPLNKLFGMEVSLLAGGDFRLRHRSPVVAGPGEPLQLISEQPAAELARILTGDPRLGASMRSELCLTSDAAPICVDARGQLVQQPQLPMAMIGSLPPGEGRGTSMATLRYWQPVGGTGLILWLMVDRAELYAPIRRGLSWGFLALAVVTGLGVALLSSRITPLARRLAQTEGSHQRVMDTVDEGLMLIDNSGRLVTINRAAAEILGFQPEEVRGRLVVGVDWQVNHEDGSPCAPEDYPAMRTLATGERCRNEVLSIDRRDGSRRWIRINSVPASGGDDGFSGVVLSFTDLTEQRLAEQASASFEAQYQTLVGGIADGVVSIDEQGTVHSFNLAAEKIFGWLADQVLGRNVTMLMPERYRANHDHNVSRFALQQDPRLIGMRRDVVGLRADGSEFPMTLALNVMPGDGPARFVALVTDISERRQAERQLQEAGRLREAILSNAPFLVVSMDVTGKVTAFNPAAERMLWYQAGEMIGQSVDRLWDSQEMVRRAADLSLQIGRTVQPGFETLVYRARHRMSEEHEWTLVRKDGSRFLSNLAVAALHDGDGAINGFLGVGYDITERKRREAHTQHIASHDFLTGLPNRMLLHDRLSMAIESAQRRGERLSVVILDLDHFKRVNDSLGHQTGDHLLIEVARRLQQAVRASDTVARMGGDEFVLLLPKVGDDPVALDVLVTKIIKAVGAPMDIDGHDLHVSPSLGIARYPEDGERPDLLLKHADVALYRAKAAGRDCYRMFNNEMAQAADERLKLEAVIRQALSENGFTMLYQPQLDIDSGAVIGMEALLRLSHPQLGVMGPERFLPVAEESGLIGPLGDWVLDTAIADAVQVEQRCGHAVLVSVNLSAQQFANVGLAAKIGALLERHGLPAARLELEITESALVHDSPETHQRLKALRALGVSVAVDNFGNGFSGLAYITRFELDTLKIDRNFVRALPDSAGETAVVRAVIALATTLDIRLVAEGVETGAQMAYLRELHRANPSPAGFAVQGHHYWPALTVDAFVALCRQTYAGGP